MLACIKLRRWRRRDKKSQAAIARVFGCSPATIGAIERGERKPGRSLAAKIEKITKIKPEEWDHV